MFYLYIATFNNNKKYIGITNNFSSRKRAHKSKAKIGESSKFYNAIRKYGFDNVSWEVISYNTNWNNMINLEKYYIQKYNTKKIGYNETDGGDGTQGYKYDERTKLRMSIARKGRKMPSGHNVGINNSMYGKKHTEAAKRKISQSRNKYKGENHPMAKITLNIAKQIREEYKSGSYTQKELSSKYNISESNVAHIIHNRCWKEI